MQEFHQLFEDYDIWCQLLVQFYRVDPNLPILHQVAATRISHLGLRRPQPLHYP
jgi:hypothetical protein